MGYDLTNSKKHYVRFNMQTWPLLLELAFHYGWNRKGTTAKDKGYLNNDSSVIPEDAINLSKALKQALTDLPNIRVYKEPHIYPKQLAELIIDPETPEDVKEYLQNLDFIAYADKTEGSEQIIKKFQDKMNPAKGQEINELLRFFSGDYNKWHIQKFIVFCKEGKGFDIG